MLKGEQIDQCGKLCVFAGIPRATFRENVEQFLRILEQVLSQMGIEECWAQPFETTAILGRVLLVDFRGAVTIVGLGTQGRRRVYLQLLPPRHLRLLSLEAGHLHLRHWCQYQACWHPAFPAAGPGLFR